MNQNMGRSQLSRVAWMTLIVVLVGAILPGPLSARQGRDETPPDTGRRYFDETGFSITGAFKTYFETHGGLEIFGYPISAPYNADGILVQYFQNARMEWHATGPESGKVELGELGRELGYQNAPSDAPLLATGRVYFDETGHSVALPFLRYYRTRGGSDFFGFPLTEMHFENQRVVQYFEKTKLIWDPQTGEVSVGNLGDLYIKVHRSSLPPTVLAATNLRSTAQVHRDLRAVVGLGQTVVSSGLRQDVRVIVLDDITGEPVPNARVYVSLFTESGKRVFGVSAEAGTDETGKMQASLPLSSIEPGTRIVANVTATDGVSSTEAEQLFLVWW
ncbi:MAG: hypothetical protein ACP5HS_13995 [Anaerolineae bacterium]